MAMLTKGICQRNSNHWREDNFVFGQIWKFRFMYTCGIDQSFRIFDPTFEWKSRFRVQSSQEKNFKQKKAKEEEKAQLYFFFNCFFNLLRKNSPMEKNFHLCSSSQWSNPVQMHRVFGTIMVLSFSTPCICHWFQAKNTLFICQDVLDWHCQNWQAHIVQRWVCTPPFLFLPPPFWVPLSYFKNP